MRAALFLVVLGATYCLSRYLHWSTLHDNACSDRMQQAYAFATRHCADFSEASALWIWPAAILSAMSVGLLLWWLWRSGVFGGIGRAAAGLIGSVGLLIGGFAAAGSGMFQTNASWVCQINHPEFPYNSAECKDLEIAAIYMAFGALVFAIPGLLMLWLAVRLARRASVRAHAPAPPQP